MQCQPASSHSEAAFPAKFPMKQLSPVEISHPRCIMGWQYLVSLSRSSGPSKQSCFALQPRICSAFSNLGGEHTTDSSLLLRVYDCGIFHGCTCGCIFVDLSDDLSDDFWIFPVFSLQLACLNAQASLQSQLCPSVAFVEVWAFFPPPEFPSNSGACPCTGSPDKQWITSIVSMKSQFSPDFPL